jgi:hypothetical protein
MPPTLSGGEGHLRGLTQNTCKKLFTGLFTSRGEITAPFLPVKSKGKPDGGALPHKYAEIRGIPEDPNNGKQFRPPKRLHLLDQIPHPVPQTTSRFLRFPLARFPWRCTISTAEPNLVAMSA